jgi:hypothetical protein
LKYTIPFVDVLHPRKEDFIPSNVFDYDEMYKNKKSRLAAALKLKETP